MTARFGSMMARSKYIILVCVPWMAPRERGVEICGKVEIKWSAVYGNTVFGRV